MIKRINKKNYKEAVELFNQYRIFYKKESDIELADSFLHSRISKNQSVVYLAYDENGIAIGLMQLYPIYSSVSAVKRWILNDLYVVETHRKTGIATKLIAKAVSFAKKDNSNRLMLETAKDNFTAKKLYESLGFVLQSTESEYDDYHLNF